MRRLLREPLLHFLLLGAVLFAAFGVTGKRTGGEAETIAVTQGRVAQLSATFARTWHRAPSPEELEGLIDNYIREEVYVRQALALGLDRDDAVIRNRLRLKMEFISDIAPPGEPTDDDLRAYLNAHRAAFRSEPRFSFSQVYLNPRRRGERLGRDAAQLLAQLNRAGGKAEVAALGDATLLEHRFSDLPAGEVAKQFGDRFAARLDELPPGQWQGPVESGYGAHLVLVSDRREGRLPALEEVRDIVRREWANAQRVERNEKLYQGLRSRYTVTVERPQAAGGETARVARQ